MGDSLSLFLLHFLPPPNHSNFTYYSFFFIVVSIGNLKKLKKLILQYKKKILILHCLTTMIKNGLAKRWSKLLFLRHGRSNNLAPILKVTFERFKVK